MNPMIQKKIFQVDLPVLLTAILIFFVFSGDCEFLDVELDLDSLCISSNADDSLAIKYHLVLIELIEYTAFLSS
jgi:hypothetical protein